MPLTKQIMERINAGKPVEIKFPYSVIWKTVGNSDTFNFNDLRTAEFRVPAAITAPFSIAMQWMSNGNKVRRQGWGNSTFRIFFDGEKLNGKDVSSNFPGYSIQKSDYFAQDWVIWEDENGC